MRGFTLLFFCLFSGNLFDARAGVPTHLDQRLTLQDIEGTYFHRQDYPKAWGTPDYVVYFLKVHGGGKISTLIQNPKHRIDCRGISRFGTATAQLDVWVNCSKTDLDTGNVMAVRYHYGSSSMPGFENHFVVDFSGFAPSDFRVGSRIRPRIQDTYRIGVPELVKIR